MNLKNKKLIEKKRHIFFIYLFSIFMLKDLKNKIFKNEILFSTFKNKQPIFLNVEKKLHKRNLELWWTLIPAIILFIIGAPSLSVLYSISELIAPELTIKAIGNQWFWTYEYSLYFGSTPELWMSYEKKRAKMAVHHDKFFNKRSLSLNHLDRITIDYGTKTMTYNYRRNRKFWIKMTDVFNKWIYRDFNLGLDEAGKRRTFNLSPDSMKRHKYFLYEMNNGFLHGFNAHIAPFIKPLLPQKLIYESHMILEDELKKGELRLLEVDYWLILPINMEMRFLVSSADVIHSFAVPALGLKVDGVPGRTNEVSVFIKRKGIFYGQCSELCGVNHGFMPIVVQAVNKNAFIDIMVTILGWDLKTILEENKK